MRPSSPLTSLLVATLLVGAWAGPAAAHPAPFSYLDIVFKGGAIDGTLVMHAIDVAHELGITPSERLLDAAVVVPLRDRIAAVLTPRMRLRSNRPLSPRWLSIEPLPDSQQLRMRFTIPGEESGSLTIDTNLFPYDPNHQTFINVYERGEIRKQLIFMSSTEEYTHYVGTTQGVVAVVKTFVASGVHHILIGPDHILFLIGLLLMGGTWGALVRIVTAFTIGHSVTLSLAVLEHVTPPATVIEPAIALSIVFVGADNLVRGNGRDLRAWVALVFGLVHGFGFAYVLREFGLPDQALGWSLFSFNLGVEIGQLAIVLIVASLLAAVRRRSTTLAYRIAYAGSVVVIAAGTYWFVQRVFFPGA
jgi:hydrogenase/urease accessory protein HupE